MKDEINKIIQSISDFYKLDNAIKYYLDRHKAQILLDYITNLQDEYEKEHYLVDKLTRQLNDEYKNTEYQCKQKEDYKLRNKKAIKCIKNKYYKEEYERKGTFINKLMNILQGEDKDVKNKR